MKKIYKLTFALLLSVLSLFFVTRSCIAGLTEFQLKQLAGKIKSSSYSGKSQSYYSVEDEKSDCGLAEKVDGLSNESDIFDLIMYHVPDGFLGGDTRAILIKRISGLKRVLSNDCFDRIGYLADLENKQAQKGGANENQGGRIYCMRQMVKCIYDREFVEARKIFEGFVGIKRDVSGKIIGIEETGSVTSDFCNAYMEALVYMGEVGSALEIFDFIAKVRRYDDGKVLYIGKGDKIANSDTYIIFMNLHINSWLKCHDVTKNGFCDVQRVFDFVAGVVREGKEIKEIKEMRGIDNLDVLTIVSYLRAAVEAGKFYELRRLYHFLFEKNKARGSISIDNVDVGLAFIRSFKAFMDRCNDCNEREVCERKTIFKKVYDRFIRNYKSDRVKIFIAHAIYIDYVVCFEGLKLGEKEFNDMKKGEFFSEHHFSFPSFLSAARGSCFLRNGPNVFDLLGKVRLEEVKQIIEKMEESCRYRLLVNAYLNELVSEGNIVEGTKMFKKLFPEYIGVNDFRDFDLGAAFIATHLMFLDFLNSGEEKYRPVNIIVRGRDFMPIFFHKSMFRALNAYAELVKGVHAGKTLLDDKGRLIMPLDFVKIDVEYSSVFLRYFEYNGKKHYWKFCSRMQNGMSQAGAGRSRRGGFGVGNHNHDHNHYGHSCMTHMSRLIRQNQNRGQGQYHNQRAWPLHRDLRQQYQKLLRNGDVVVLQVQQRQGQQEYLHRDISGSVGGGGGVVDAAAVGSGFQDYYGGGSFQ